MPTVKSRQSERQNERDIKRSVRVEIGTKSEEKQTKSKSGASRVITFLLRDVTVINCHQHQS